MPLDQTANDYLRRNAQTENNKMEGCSCNKWLIAERLLGKSFGFVGAQVPEARVGFLFSHLGFPKGDARR